MSIIIHRWISINVAILQFIFNVNIIVEETNLIFQHIPVDNKQITIDRECNICV